MMFLSLGGNCVPGFQIERKFGADGMYFNYTVTPYQGLVRLLESNFKGSLEKGNLAIGQWEGHDSVYDSTTNIFYHHDFLCSPERHHANGRRMITPDDISSYYHAVKSKYDYLAAKFLKTIASGVPLAFIRREYDGSCLDPAKMERVDDLLRSLGAKNYRLICVHHDSSLEWHSTHKGYDYFLAAYETRPLPSAWATKDESWDAIFKFMAEHCGADYAIAK